MRLKLLLATIVVGITILPGQAQSSKTALAWIKSLAGEWKGSLQWSGARSEKGEIEARYYATGNGSAMVEDLVVSGEPTMTSVYHLDGADLRMTHFCGAANQPRLKASTIDPEKKLIRFDFVDITNLAAPSAGHVQRVQLRLLDENHILLTFTFLGAGAESVENIDLTRVKSSARK